MRTLSLGFTDRQIEALRSYGEGKISYGIKKAIPLIEKSRLIKIKYFHNESHKQTSVLLNEEDIAILKEYGEGSYVRGARRLVELILNDNKDTPIISASQIEADRVLAEFTANKELEDYLKQFT